MNQLNNIETNHMPRSQKNDNFIDKTFTIIADILLRIVPTSQREREAFTYYRDGAIWKKIFYFFKIIKFTSNQDIDFFFNFQKHMVDIWFLSLCADSSFIYSIFNLNLTQLRIQQRNAYNTIKQRL